MTQAKGKPRKPARDGPNKDCNVCNGKGWYVVKGWPVQCRDLGSVGHHGQCLHGCVAEAVNNVLQPCHDSASSHLFLT